MTQPLPPRPPEPVAPGSLTHRRSALTLLAALVVAVALLVAMSQAAVRTIRDSARGQDPRVVARALRDAGRLRHVARSRPGGPRRAFVGVYAFHVPQLDLAAGAYLVDFWVWFRWQGDDIDPSRSFEFMNQFQGWDTLREAVYTDEAGNARPDPLGNGWFYQVLHVQTRFEKTFDLRAYPFDAQDLVIAFEDGDQTIDSMVYVADEGTNIVDPSLNIPGWRLTGISTSVVDVAYATNFGDLRRPVGADRYTQFRYTIHIARPVLGHLVATLLPITVVVLVALLTFLVGSKYFEGRLGLGVASLLCALVLRLNPAQELPRTGYPVLVDHVYNLGYVVILLTLAESVFAARLRDAGREDAARRLDRASLFALAAAYLGVVSGLIATR